jgi:hypothetical protein
MEAMSDHTELDAILTGSAEPTGEPAVEAAPEAPEAPPAEKAEAAPPAAEKPPEEPKDSKPPPGFVPHQALAEERRKRQEYERELSALRQKAQEAEAAKPKPNLFESPDEWEKHLEERVTRITAEAEARAQARFIALAEQDARTRYPDYEEAVQAFTEAARETPALIEEARAATNPVEFVYKSGKNLKTFREAGSLEELIKQAEARGEERARQALQSKPVPEVPESLTDIAGAKGETTKTWSGPKPLTDLLPTY